MTGVVKVWASSIKGLDRRCERDWMVSRKVTYVIQCAVLSRLLERMQGGRSRVGHT